MADRTRARQPGVLQLQRTGTRCPLHDHEPSRTWRHLDTCQYRTILQAAAPRTNCLEHGVLAVSVPWAEPNSRFTSLFERLAIDWMQEAGRSVTARRMNLTWDQADGIMQRAVERGLARREKQIVPRIGVEAVAMDMWDPYIAATCKYVPEAEEKIVFDRFHISKHLNEAVDKVRRQEHTQLQAAHSVELRVPELHSVSLELHQ